MKKILFILLGLFLILFSGCSSVGVSFVDSDSLATALNNTTIKTNITSPTYEDKALILMAWEEMQIHEGKHFYKREYFPLAGSSTLNVLIYTGEQEAHFLPAISGNDGAINVSFWENPTVTTNGTLVPYFNSNYNYNDTNGLTFYRGGSVSALGTFKGRNYVGSGRTYGGTIRATDEIVLKPNSTYLMQIGNQIVTSNVIDCVFTWYDYETHD